MSKSLTVHDSFLVLKKHLFDNCMINVFNLFKYILQTPMLDEKTGKTKEKVTAFIVERDFGGVTRLYFQVDLTFNE